MAVLVAVTAILPCSAGGGAGSGPRRIQFTPAAGRGQSAVRGL